MAAAESFELIAQLKRFWAPKKKNGRPARLYLFVSNVLLLNVNERTKDLNVLVVVIFYIGESGLVWSAALIRLDLTWVEMMMMVISK